MFRRITIVLCVVGLAVTAYVVATAKETVHSPPPARPPSVNPFERGIAAVGIIEPATRTIGIAAPEPGRVVEVLVSVNQQVRSGDPLFRLDASDLEAELVKARAAADAATAEVTRLEAWPRPEDFPPVEAEIVAARARFVDAEARFQNMQAAGERGAASDDEVRRQRYLVEALRANLAEAEARLARMKAGSWTEDLEVARANAALRRAEIESIRLRIERLTVRAPIDGAVLKRNIEPGEFVSGGSSLGAALAARAGGGAPIVLGDLREMHVRAQVDEEDAPMLREAAPAVARVRGQSRNEIPLRMIRVEPLAIPKRHLTGAGAELVDTRVIDVVLLVLPRAPGPRLYPGQIVDVFIGTQESDEASAAQASRAGSAASQ